MSKRKYRQYCGFARALEVIGERWVLMIVRDLLVGPKRFGEIHRGLPGIPTNILTRRLNELEEAQIVERRLAVRPSRGFIYALTSAGEELNDVVIAIGRWGAKRLGDPRADESITEDSIATALRSTFRPKNARGVNTRYLLKVGEIEVSAHVHRGSLAVKRGPIDNPDLIIEAGPAIRGLMAHEITPKEAIDRRLVRVTGNPALLDLFVAMFQI
ncbi:MAG TPA: helix-turn-helix domain-containing protein [Candidatus Baltobacteraceae bacterium]|nr:helix-turn-helix domain-containing protein [Candidatus Baltobacteraceae bacterium]